MHGEHELHHRCVIRRSMLALTVALTMLCSILPTPVVAIASGDPSECLCGHTHDADCGYVEGSEGTPCAHAHDANCGYVEGSPCSDVHVHDESCGYSEPVLAAPCIHICEILSFSDYTPGEAISTYEAESGDTYDDICAALPEALSGTLACAGGDVNIPLRWSCADYSAKPGTYTFCAELDNAHCVFAVADDELTEDVDESELPFITVTVPEAAAPAPTPAPANNTYTISDDTNTVSVSGLMPEGAYLEVEEVAVEAAQELLGESEAVVLFAYDIRIMLPGALDKATGEYGEPTEYQPTAERPVTVTITPPEPIAAPTVEVVHIAENDTGEMTTQPVQNVTTTENSVEFAAEAFSIYIGTMGSGTSITLTPSDEYKFYSDIDCLNEISGEQNVTLPQTIYLQASPNYAVSTVSIKNEDNSASKATAMNSGGKWTLSFPQELTNNQIITVTTWPSAPGGVISSSSTAADVAAMFDSSAETGAAETDNVTVTGSGGTFTVEVNNNIILTGTITVCLGADVTLTTRETATVKRDVALCNGLMFAVSGTLSLGTGTGSGGTVTYNFSDNTLSDPLAPNDDIPTPSGNASIIGVTVHKTHESTTAGTLIIDGGAVFSTPINAAAKTTPVCTTATTGSIIESSGTLNLWNGVTLQNNFTNLSSTAHVDQLTDAGVRIIGGEFYMYGGIITQCSTWCGVSFSDGGGICFTDGDAYFYGGEITQCCADNGAAVAIFGANENTPTAYYLGTYIHDNLASNHRSFPGQACSAYNGAAIRMFAGSIINNKNTFDDSDTDAHYDVKPSGTNSGVNLFGGTIGKLGVVDNSTVNVYGCDIATVSGAGNVVYKKGYAVTIPDCVAANTTDAVTISVKKDNDGTFEGYITITKTGGGTSNDLQVDLLAGNYEIAVDSPSMRKVYSALVNEDPVMAEPVSRTITAPVLKSRTSNSIHLIPAGTGNASADGIIYYGYSSTNDATGVPAYNSGSDGAWQTSSTFITSDLTGNRYFFIKAVAPSTNTYNFNVSTSSGLVLSFGFTPSVQINDNGLGFVSLNAGMSTTLSITTTPEYYAPECISWDMRGQEHPETGITIRPDGSATVKINAAETATSFTVTVELLDKDRQRIGEGVIDSITVRIDPLAYIEYTVLEAPTTLTAQLSLGSVGPYTYQWELADIGSSDYSPISGATNSTYSATYSDVGKNIRVVITDGVEYTSAPVKILAPTLNVTVPLDTVVTVDAAGRCTVAGGSVTNNSTVPVYVTGVDYNWQTSGDRDADELFYDYKLVTATLTLNETAYNFSGEDPSAASPTTASGVIDAKAGDTAGTLALSWAFNLGTGNYLKLAPTVGSPAQVATVTYTVDYQPPPTTP